MTSRLVRSSHAELFPQCAWRVIVLGFGEATGDEAKPRVRRTLGALATLVLAACGGGGGGGGGGPAPTYTISGAVTAAVSGAGLQGIGVELTGAASKSATTDASGNYSFTGLSTGAYTVAPTSANVANFSPSTGSVMVNGSNVTNENFSAVEVAAIAAGVTFLPQEFITSNEYRASLVAKGGNLYFTDSSDAPLKQLSLANSAIVPLASVIGAAENVAIDSQNVFWVDGGRLNESTIGGSTTTLLASGARDPFAGATADIALDAANVYWVNTVSTPTKCTPSCTWIVQQVPLAGGAASTLATVGNEIVALTSDANNIYWQEGSFVPVSAGCNCGSSIKMLPKSGGTPVVLVDNLLNETLPPPPPGETPGTWMPIGGIAVSGSQLIFGVAGNSSYRIMSIPTTGGSLSTLTSVGSTASIASGAIRNIRSDGVNAYWIDPTNTNLDSVPLAGGAMTVVADGLKLPPGFASGYLAINAGSAFWSEPGTAPGCCLQAGSGDIRTVPLTGGTPSTVISFLDNPGALAADSTNLVWTEAWRVGQAPAGGGQTATLASGISSVMARIAVDQTTIYILDGNFIKTVPIAGGPIGKLSSANGGLIGALNAQDQDIATDGTNVYWSVSGGQGLSPMVQQIAVAGGMPLTLSAGGMFGSPEDCYWRIAVDSQSVYWSTTSTQNPVGCAIDKVPIGGGSVMTLVDYAYFADFTVRGPTIYFSELGTNPGSIRSVPVAGGPSTSVVTDVVAEVLTSDATDVYWIDPRRIGGGGIGALSRANTFGSLLLAMPLVTDPTQELEGIATGPGGVYFTDTVLGAILSIE